MGLSLRSAPPPELFEASIARKNQDKATLTSVSLKLSQGFTLVMGTLSSGKSTLLHTFLSETVVAGSSSVANHGLTRRITLFVTQKPWVQETLSIRANIVFHHALPIDPNWYQVVLEASTLKPDLATFPKGDLRIASGLSGGQKQRVNIARALYASRQAEMVVLDAPFSALDAKTESHFWTALFDGQKGLLPQKRVIMATNAECRMKDANWVARVQGNRVFVTEAVEAMIPAQEIVPEDGLGRAVTASVASTNPEDEDEDSNKIDDAYVKRVPWPLTGTGSPLPAGPGSLLYSASWCCTGVLKLCLVWSYKRGLTNPMPC